MPGDEEPVIGEILPRDCVDPPAVFAGHAQV